MEYISQPDKASIQFVHIVKNIKILFRMPTQSAVGSITFSICKKIWKKHFKVVSKPLECK